jgi:penicillin-binding protein 1A
MRTVGGLAAMAARILLGRTWAGLRSDLVSAYLKFNATVRGRLPPSMVATLVAAEDPRFDRHRGIDPIGFLRAIWRLRLGHALARGGTLEHRLVRILLGPRGRGTAGTMRALALAALVETVIPKVHIPGVYLTVAYFGWGMDGIHQACRRLGFDLRRLTPLQAASIVARLRYPEPEVMSFKRAHRIAVRAQRVLRLAGQPGATLSTVQEAAARPEADERSA